MKTSLKNSQRNEDQSERKVGDQRWLVFKWGLGPVLTNSHCVKITHDSRLLREAFDFEDINLLLKIVADFDQTH